MQPLYRMAARSQLVTAEELEKFPDDDYRYELVEGRVIRMSPVGLAHGVVAMRFGARLTRHVEAHALGVVCTEVGFKLASNPDTVRAPDIAFIRRDRLPPGNLSRGFFNGPTDLVVEVLSPDDRPVDVRAKVEEYLTRSVLLVLVLDPDRKTATAYRRLAAPVTLTVDDDLDLTDIVHDFKCRVREIFE